MRKSMQRIRNQVREPRCEQLFLSDHLEEGGSSSVHPLTRRLGNMSGKNDSRDFWNHTGAKTIAAWLAMSGASAGPTPEYFEISKILEFLASLGGSLLLIIII